MVRDRASESLLICCCSPHDGQHCHDDDRDDPRYSEASYPWNAQAPDPRSAPIGASSVSADLQTSLAASDLETKPATSGTAQSTGDITKSPGSPEWQASLDAAEAKFARCVQTLRSPAWSEFAQPPTDDNAYEAWASRFNAASREASDRCQRQEAGSVRNYCKLMQMSASICDGFLGVISQSVMNGTTQCGAQRCVRLQ